jgi:hypothetical protein
MLGIGGVERGIFEVFGLGKMCKGLHYLLVTFIVAVKSSWSC